MRRALAIPLHGYVQCTAVDEKVLTDDKLGLLAAQKGAGGAEIGGGAICASGDARLAAGAGFVNRDAFCLCGPTVQAVGAVGRVQAGKDVVHRDTVLGHIARHSGDEAGQTGARSV